MAHATRRQRARRDSGTWRPPISRRATSRRSLAVLVALVFSKFIYLTSLTNYYTFFLMHRFGVSIQQAQIHLFVFLAAVAVGTFAGGPIGDRIGRKAVIWVLDSRRPALLPRAALRQSRLDRRCSASSSG